MSTDVDADPSAAEAAEPATRLTAVPPRTAPKRARENVVMLLAMTLVGRPRAGSSAGLARVPWARRHEKGKDAGEQSDGDDEEAIGVSHHEGFAAHEVAHDLDRSHIGAGGSCLVL